MRNKHLGNCTQVTTHIIHSNDTNQEYIVNSID